MSALRMEYLMAEIIEFEYLPPRPAQQSRTGVAPF